jgi:hypothetical protein
MIDIPCQKVKIGRVTTVIGDSVENWKDIEGFEGCYQVSDLGRVRSLDRMVPYKIKGEFRISKGKVLKSCPNSQGYCVNVLTKENVRTTFMTHNLVAHHFLGERPNNLVIDHLDGNPRNNRADNLEYVSFAENVWRGKSGSKRKGKASKHRFITYSKNRVGKKKWCAQIRRNGKLFNSNYVESEELALVELERLKERFF